VRFVEAVKNRRHGPTEWRVKKGPPIDAKQVGASVVIGHARTVVIDAVSSVVLFEIVLQAMEDAAQIFGGLPVGERNQLEEDVER
jgi:hypothetical protein